MSRVKLKCFTKKQEEKNSNITRDKLASSWASYTCAWWQAYTANHACLFPSTGGEYTFKVCAIRIAISSCCWPHVAAGVA